MTAHPIEQLGAALVVLGLVAIAWHQRTPRTSPAIAAAYRPSAN